MSLTDVRVRMRWQEVKVAAETTQDSKGYGLLERGRP